MLLLLHDENGRFERVPDWSLGYALGGGVLMDLALENRIDTDLDNLILVDDTPLGDSLLDPTLAEIAAAEDKRDARFWVERTAGRADEIRRRRWRASSRTAFWRSRKTASSGFSAPAATPSSTAGPNAR